MVSKDLEEGFSSAFGLLREYCSPRDIKKKLLINVIDTIQCNEAESASPRPENKYSGVPEAYSGLVTFKYASGTPEYIYISYQHFGHEQKSISPQILWFSIQR